MTWQVRPAGTAEQSRQLVDDATGPPPGAINPRTLSVVTSGGSLPLRYGGEYGASSAPPTSGIKRSPAGRSSTAYHPSAGMICRIFPGGVGTVGVSCKP